VGGGESAPADRLAQRRVSSRLRPARVHAAKVFTRSVIACQLGREHRNFGVQVVHRDFVLLGVLVTVLSAAPMDVRAGLAGVGLSGWCVGLMRGWSGWCVGLAIQGPVEGGAAVAEDVIDLPSAEELQAIVDAESSR
jgi:hypothetical protein